MNNYYHNNKKKISKKAKVYYQENKKEILKRTKLWASKNKDKRRDYIVCRMLVVNLFKESEPCTDCKEKYPFYIMQWDHCRGQKEFCLGGGSLNFSTPRLQKEAEKCDLVCANCHCIRTEKRKNV